MPENLYSTKHFDAYLKGVGFIEGSEEPIKLKVHGSSIYLNDKIYDLKTAMKLDAEENVRKLFELANSGKEDSIIKILDESDQFIQDFYSLRQKYAEEPSSKYDAPVLQQKIRTQIEMPHYIDLNELNLANMIIEHSKSNYEVFNGLLDYPEIVKAASDPEIIYDLVRSADERIIYKMIDIKAINQEAAMFMFEPNISPNIVNYFVKHTEIFETATEDTVISLLTLVTKYASKSGNNVPLQIMFATENIQNALESAIANDSEKFYNDLLEPYFFGSVPHNYFKVLLRHAPSFVLKCLIDRMIERIEEVDHGSLINEDGDPLLSTVIYLYLRDSYKHQDFIDMVGDDDADYHEDTKMLIALHKSLESDADDYELISEHLDESLQLLLIIIKYSNTDEIRKYIKKLEYIINNLEVNKFVNLIPYAFDDNNLLQATGMLKDETNEKLLSLISESDYMHIAKLLIKDNSRHQYLTDNPLLGLKCINQALEHLSNIEPKDFQETDIEMLKELVNLMTHFDIVLDPESLEEDLPRNCNEKLNTLRIKITDKIDDPKTSTADKEKYLEIDESLRPVYARLGMRA